jgi:hypothetical protein
VVTGGWRGPGWRVTGAGPRHGSAVREWVTSVIAAYGCPAGLDDAALITGELYANAVLHGPQGGRVLTGYCLWREGARIVVCDGGGPRGAGAAPARRRGRRGVTRAADLGRPLPVPHAEGVGVAAPRTARPAADRRCPAVHAARRAGRGRGAMSGTPGAGSAAG